MLSTHTVTLILVLFLGGAIAASIQKRDFDEDDSKPSICHRRTPCAWAVYVPFSRKIEYYMKNTCDCEAGKQCMKADDDIAVSAYVYRCSEGSNSTTTNSGEVGTLVTS